jgi:hypothetical protein
LVNCLGHLGGSCHVEAQRAVAFNVPSPEAA